MQNDIVSINQRLGDYFGRFADNRPLHRIIWSTNLTEKRRGDYDITTEAGIFLREETNLVKEVLKYPFDQNRHVFEALIPTPTDLENELVEKGKMDYECFYIFKDKTGKALPLVWKAVEAIMHFKLYAKTPKKSALDLIGEQEKLEANEVKYFEDELKDASSIIAPNFGVKGIFVPSNYEKNRYKSGRLMDNSLVKV